jgi:DNA repair exonuclease SbcCD ATPase subunit
MTDVSSAVTEIGSQERQINEHSRLTSEINTCLTNAKTAKADVERLKGEKNPFLEMAEAEAAKLTKLTRDLADITNQVEEAAKDVEVASNAVKVFGPTGVRVFLLDTVTPYLNERTSHYLGTLSDGRIEAVWTTLAKSAKGELIERFSIEVEKADGGKSFKALSGGEKRKVRLACALALQDLVGSRATKPINLWIGDEIDDALDEAGLERLMAVLEEKAREKGTVAVISHNSLRDWIRETVTVTKEGGRSTVSGALC